MATYEDATPVAVTAGEQRTSIDAALPRGGRITGRLVAADTGGHDTITATVDLDEDGERDPFEARRYATVGWTLLPPF